MHLKKLERKDQNKPKGSRKKEKKLDYKWVDLETKRIEKNQWHKKAGFFKDQ